MANLVDSLVEEITARLRPIIAEAVQTVLIGGSAEAPRVVPARRGRAPGSTRGPAKRRVGGADSYVVGETRGRVPGWLAGSTGATSSKDLAKRWSKGTVLTKGQQLPPESSARAPETAAPGGTPAPQREAEEQKPVKARAPRVRKTGSARKLSG